MCESQFQSKQFFKKTKNSKLKNLMDVKKMFKMTFKINCLKAKKYLNDIWIAQSWRVLFNYSSLGRNKCSLYCILLAVFNHFWAIKWNLTHLEPFFFIRGLSRKILAQNSNFGQKWRQRHLGPNTQKIFADVGMLRNHQRS